MCFCFFNIVEESGLLKELYGTECGQKEELPVDAELLKREDKSVVESGTDTHF